MADATLTELIKIVQGQHLELDLNNGKWDHNGKWDLRIKGKPDYVFEYVGSGAAKHVFRFPPDKAAKHVEWVLCFLVRPKAIGAVDDLKSEIATLQRIGKAGAVVPTPFPFKNEKPNEYLVKFNLDNLDSSEKSETLGFILGYLDTKDRYIEMIKKDQTVDDRCKWLGKQIDQSISDRTKKENLKRSFGKIQEAWAGGKWGDFQVLLDKKEGNLMVFDPNKEMTTVGDTDKILGAWKACIADKCR